jgi:hypothetical protein
MCDLIDYSNLDKVPTIFLNKTIFHVALIIWTS